MFRGLTIYLCVYLCFPPHIWANAGAYADPIPPTSPVAKPVAAPESDRVQLRRKLHEASWAMAKVARKRIPGIVKLKASEFYSLLRPYDHCLEPLGDLPDSIDAIDEKILKPAGAALAAFLRAHEAEIGKLGFEPDDATAPVNHDVLHSKETGAVCRPSLWRKEASAAPAGGEKMKHWVEQVESEALAYQDPLYTLLARRNEGPLTDVEIRRWIGWYASLREFRNTLAKYYQYREDTPYAAAPELTFSARLGKKLASNLHVEKSKVAADIAKALVNGTVIAHGLEELPSFAPCAQGRAEWCFHDGKPSVGVEVDEEILLKLQAAKPTHGRDLDAIRKIAIKALMAELITVNSLLPGQEQGLAQACVTGGDLGAHRRFFDDFSKIDETQWWAQRFGLAVADLEREYREGATAIPRPHTPKFFEQGQKIANEWMETYFRRHTLNAGSAPVESPVRARVLAELRAVPFADRILEARGSEIGGYATLLSEKLRVWFALVQGELGSLSDPTQRAQVIREMIRQVVGFVMIDALENYVLSLAADEGFQGEELSNLWGQTFQARWRTALESAELKSDLDGVAASIADRLLSDERLRRPFDRRQLAEEALSNYALKVAPRVRQAAAAEDTSQFMRTLKEWKEGPWNLLPGPWNFHWQAAGGVINKRKFDSGSPAIFQVDDEKGHGYGYTMPLPDALLPDEYIHLKTALKEIAARQRDKIIERLKARGYTDEGVRRQFTAQAVRDVGTLADLILRKFNETVDADETSDRGRVAQNREAAFAPLSAWFSSKTAASEYQALAREFTASLYYRYLRALLDDVAQGRGQADLEALLKRLGEEEIFLHSPSVVDVTKIYREYQARVEAERESDELKRHREVLRRLHEAGRDTNAFQNAEAWKKFCLTDKAKCEAWVKSMADGLGDTPVMRSLHAARVAAATEETLLDFLRHFGTDGAVYDGKVPADVAKAAIVTNAKETLLRAWVGWSLPAGEVVAVHAEIDEWLKSVSQAARASSREAVLFARRADIQALAEKLYPRWRAPLDAEIKKISEALKGDEKTVVSAFDTVSNVFHKEYLQTYAIGRRTLAETLLIASLTQVMTPPFWKFRDLVEKRIEKAITPRINPAKHVVDAESALRDFKDREWTLKKEGKEGSREYKIVMADIGRVETVLKRAKDALQNDTELKRILRNYLPTLPAAAQAFQFEKQGKTADDLATVFFNDQFLTSETDATGKSMDTSLSRALEDLNRLAVSQSRNLAYDAKLAKRFVESAVAYCGQAGTPAYQKAYRDSVHGAALQIAAAPVVVPALRRWWTVKNPAGKPEEFNGWLEVVKSRLASAGDALNQAVDAGLPGAEQWCAATVETSKKALENEKNFWAFVEDVSSLWLAGYSRFAPLLGADGKIVWLASAPTPEVGVAFERAEEIRELDGLNAALRQLKLTKEQWTQAVGNLAPLPGDSLDAKVAWLNGLDIPQRAAIWKGLQTLLAGAVKNINDKAPAVEAVETEGLKLLTHAQWHRRLRRHLIFWDRLKADARAANGGSVLDVVKHRAFKDLVARIGGLFFAVAPFQFEGSVLSRGTEVVEPEASMAKLKTANASLQRKILEDIEARYNDEHRSNPLPFAAFLPAPEIANVVPQDNYGRLLEFHLDRFVADPADMVALSAPSVGDWRAHFQARFGAALPSYTTAVGAFSLDGGYKGSRGNQAETFKNWVETLSQSERGESSFAALSKTLLTVDRKHLWHSFATVQAFRDSPLFGQLTGLLQLHDLNSRAMFLPKSYPYFLIHLHWNTRHHGSEPAIGPTALAQVPSEKLLAKLMGEVVAVLDLDTKSFFGWEPIVRRLAEPADWQGIADSQRNLLVGTGERRFLGTMVEAPTTSNPTSLAPNYNYRPFPIVDANERLRLASDKSFNEWWARTEDPALNARYRVSAEDAASRPLYAQLLAAQNEMLGERDIVEENPLKRERFTSQKDWSTHYFGNTALPPGRVNTLVSRAGALNVKTSASEVEKVAGVREALVELRRTLSELNLRYAHEDYRWLQGKGNDIPQRGGYQKEVEEALKRFSKQMGGDGKIPNLGVRNPRPDGKDDLAARRREIVARAIYWASHLSHEKVFGKAKTDEEKNRLERLLLSIDGFYAEAGMKIELRRGLRAVATNIDKQLQNLCGARALADITTDEEFRKAKKFLEEETKIVHFDNLVQLLYEDSGWIQEGENQPETRRLIAQMVREQAEHKKFMAGVSTVVNWLVVVSLVVLAFGRGPGMGRMAASSRLAQGVVAAITIAAAAGFAAVEGYEIYEDYWGRPDELALLTSVRDTQFVGASPLMSDSAGVAVDEKARQLASDQKSTFRWAMHLLGVTTGIQLMSPLAKWAKGRVLYFIRTPLGAVNARFRPHAKILGATGSSPYQATEALGAEAAEARIHDAYARATGAPVVNGEVTITKAMRDDIRRQRELLAREWGLDAETLKPLGEEAAASSFAKWDPRRWHAEWLARGRKQAMERLEMLRGLSKRSKIGVDEIPVLLAAEADPAIRHTPFLWSLFGLPYPSSRIRELRKLRSIAQANLDVMALHDPQVFTLLAYLNQTGLPGGKVEKWELFSAKAAKRLADVPRDVRAIFRNLYKDAKGLAEESLGMGGVFETAGEREMYVRFLRQVFDEALLGVTMNTRRFNLIERYRRLFEAGPLKKYRPEVLHHYKEMFLIENGIGISNASRDRMRALNELANWHFQAEGALREFAKQHGVSEEEVLYWMLRPEHPNYRLFQPVERPVEAPVFEGGEPGIIEGTAEAKTIHDYAAEIRAIFDRGRWVPDRELLKAIAAADYRTMAGKFVRWKVIPRKPGDNGEVEDFSPGEDPPPSSDPEPTIPTKPKERIVESPPTEPPTPRKPPGPEELPDDILSSKTFGPMKDFNEMLKLGGVHIPPEDKKIVIELLLQRTSAKDLQRALGRLRKAGTLTPEVEAAYKIAIAHTRAMELAESLPSTVERLALYQWCMDAHVANIERVASTELSLAEAREILGMSKDSWMSLARIDDAAAALKGKGVDSELVDRAVQALRRVHPEQGGPKSVEDLALALNVPVEYFGSQSVAGAIGAQRVRFHPEAEQMAYSLFRENFHQTVEDATRCLAGVEPEALKQSLQRRLDLTQDPAARVIYKRAIERVDLAAHIVKNPSKFPKKFELPEVVIPRYDYVDIEIATDAWFLKHVSGYPKEVVEKILKTGIDKARMELFAAMAEGRIPVASFPTQERLSRLIHAALLMENARANAKLSAETLEAITQIILKKYVRTANVRFEMIPTEAEEFIYAFFKKFNGATRERLKLHKDETLQELMDVLRSKTLLTNGVAPEVHKQLVEAALTLHIARHRFGIEHLVLTTKSHAPLELIVSLIGAAEKNTALYPEVRRLIYQLTEGPAAKWNSDGTHQIGDLFLHLFGPNSGRQIVLQSELRKRIAKELKTRVQWAKKAGDTELKDAFEQALKRL